MVALSNRARHVAFLNQSSRAFEAKHRVIIRSNEVTVSGRFLGLIPLPAVFL